MPYWSTMGNGVPYSGTSAVDKALDVLLAIHSRGESVGVSELARELGAPKSTVHRLLKTLERRGFIEKDEGEYRLGFALAALGLASQDGQPLVRVGRDALVRATETTGETSFLVASRGGALRVLHRVEGSGFVRAMPTLGEEVPVHATAAGRLYLAYAPDEVRAGSELEIFTGATPRDAATLERRVEEARGRGWDANLGEWIEEAAVVAAPVLVGPRLHGVVAIATSVGRVEKLGVPALADAVLEAATSIGRRLKGEA